MGTSSPAQNRKKPHGPAMVRSGCWSAINPFSMWESPKIEPHGPPSCPANLRQVRQFSSFHAGEEDSPGLRCGNPREAFLQPARTRMIKSKSRIRKKIRSKSKSRSTTTVGASFVRHLLLLLLIRTQASTLLFDGDQAIFFGERREG